MDKSWKAAVVAQERAHNMNRSAAMLDPNVEPFTNIRERNTSYIQAHEHPSPKFPIQKVAKVSWDTNTKYIMDQSEGQTEVDVFGQFIVMMLQRMNEPCRFSTMLKISNILFENIISSRNMDAPMDEELSETESN